MGELTVAVRINQGNFSDANDPSMQLFKQTQNFTLFLVLANPNFERVRAALNSRRF